MERRKKRAKAVIGISFLSLILFLAFSGSTTLAAEEIRIGFMAPMKGPLAKPGEDLLNGFKLFWKQIHIVGSTMGSPADFAAMIEFVNQHGIRPVVDNVFPLAEGNDALDRMKRSTQFGKLVLNVAE